MTRHYFKRNYTALIISVNDKNIQCVCACKCCEFNRTDLIMSHFVRYASGFSTNPAHFHSFPLRYRMRLIFSSYFKQFIQFLLSIADPVCICFVFFFSEINISYQTALFALRSQWVDFLYTRYSPIVFVEANPLCECICSKHMILHTMATSSADTLNIINFQQVPVFMHFYQTAETTSIVRSLKALSIQNVSLFIHSFVWFVLMFQLFAYLLILTIFIVSLALCLPTVHFYGR